MAGITLANKSVLIVFISEAARHQFPKNKNCCFVDQGTFRDHTNIFTETRLDLFIKHCLRVILDGFSLLWRHFFFSIKNSFIKNTGEFETVVCIGCLFLEKIYFDVGEESAQENMWITSAKEILLYNFIVGIKVSIAECQWLSKSSWKKCLCKINYNYFLD